MRYSKNLFRQAISQWRDCYIDYQFLKIFINVIKMIVEELQEIAETIDQDKTNRNSDSNSNNKNNQQTITNSKPESKLTTQNLLVLNQANQKLRKIIQQTNAMFTQSFKQDIRICKGFCHIKFHQIHKKYTLFFMYAPLADDQKKVRILLSFVQYTYVQAVYLTRMYESNIEAERKILKKHKKYAKKMIATPQVTLPQKLNTKEMDKLVDQIENYYVQISHNRLKKKQKTKISRKHIRSLTKQSQATNKDSFTFGLFVGSFFAVIVFMSFLLAYEEKSVETDPIFNRDFPTWRGIAFLIFYIWVIGLNIYFFQKYMISHRIIFDFGSHHYSHSTRIFKIAGFLSTIFVVMFTLYALSLAQFFVLYNFENRYLSLIIWGFFLAFLFNPFPIIYFRSRRFVFLLLFKIIVSPFIGVPFVVTWATDQLVSLLTPFQDMVYSMCYFTGGVDFSDHQVTNNRCRNPARIAVFIFGVIVFAYRILQCMRQGYDKRKYWREHQFYNTIKYLFSLMTLVFSFLWKNGSSNIFAGWLTFAIISTIYSYVWDLKIDWQLLDRKAEYCLLRDKLTYLPRNYYIFMFLNLILRLAWVTTLSQNITDKLLGSPQLFRLVAGALEIARRGIWNLLRVERQHLKNCIQFKALPSKSVKLQKQIKKSIQQNKDKANIQSMERIKKFHQKQQDDLIQIDLQSEQKKSEDRQIIEQKFKNYKDIQIQIEKHQKYKKQILSQLKIKEKQAKKYIKTIKAILKV